jgi:predicted transposase/invertase (TIGR01784 family)
MAYHLEWKPIHLRRTDNSVQTVLKSGDQYGLLKQSICINVLDFIMFDSPGFYSDFTVMERVRHEALSDKCAILFLELPKIGKEIHIENRLELWLKVIKSCFCQYKSGTRILTFG